MIEPILIEFLWNSIATGVVGNSAYDAIKSSLGKGFDILSTCVAESRESDFNIAISAILLTNEKLLNELQEIQRSGEQLPLISQSHTGVGDNIAGDKIVHGNSDYISGNKVVYSAVQQEESLNLTVALVDALELHHPIKKTWNEPVFVIGAYNFGSIPVHIKTLGGKLTDGQMGDFVSFQGAVIAIGKESTWVIPLSQLMKLDTGETINGFSVVSTRSVESENICAIYLESHTGKIFIVGRDLWAGIS